MPPKKSSNGKGDSPRPLGITKEEWEKRWKSIFGKNKNKSKERK